MSARETLAENLRRLMAAHHTHKTTPALERATEAVGLKVGKSTIDRALKMVDQVLPKKGQTLELPMPLS